MRIKLFSPYRQILVHMNGFEAPKYQGTLRTCQIMVMKVRFEIQVPVTGALF